jgi:hypothetical protein
MKITCPNCRTKNSYDLSMAASGPTSKKCKQCGRHIKLYAYDIKKLFFSYKIENGKQDEFSLKIEEMRIPYEAVTSILGMSGHGKTTLLSLLGFLRKPKSGKMTLNIRLLEKGYDYDEVWQSENTVTNLRKKSLGFALQRGELAPFLNVGQNIYMPLKLNQLEGDQARSRKDELLKIFFPTKKTLRGRKLRPKCLMTCQAANTSEQPLPERWPMTRIYCWQMNQPARWTFEIPKRSWNISRKLHTNRASVWLWLPTASLWLIAILISSIW